MSQHQGSLRIETSGRGVTDVTAGVAAIVRASGIGTGLCLVFCRHTSCSLVIQENADPSARADLMAWLERIAPDGDPLFRHVAEGPDDSPAHVRSAVTRTAETIPVTAGGLALGTWQGIFLVEHRLAPHSRSLIVHVTGE